MQATCKTCGGSGGRHVPSPLDKDGVGNPGHKMPSPHPSDSEQLIKGFIERLRDPSYHINLNVGEAVITINDENKTISMDIPSHYISKQKVLEAIGEDETHSNGSKLVNPWTCDDCGLPQEEYTRNQLRHQIKASLGLEEEKK